MPVNTLIFDLDGTLVDSASSILAAYGAALAQLGCTPLRPLTRDLIGPPLDATMDLLTGGVDRATRAALVQAFKQHYDLEGYRQTEVFDGIPALLAALQAQGLRLFIATNKRIAPTRSILAHLGWTGHFQGVYALDALQPPAPDKGALLRHLLQHEGLHPDTAVYIGDRAEDAVAAATAGLRFEPAPWGFGTQEALSADVPVARQVGQLAQRLHQLTQGG